MIFIKVGWFSCGCSSLVACKLAKPDKIIYIHVSDQHPDTLRFLYDAETILGKIIVLQSKEYKDVDEVLANGYINGPTGAPCTLRLKKRVRQKWEKENWGRHTYVWDFDSTEKKRADRIVNSMPEFDHRFPLIENNLTKADCHALCSDCGIKRPVMYDLGYPNNNCIGCIKGGMGYWNKIRDDFPDVFESRAKRERSVGHSCIKGMFLDELPRDRGRCKPIVADCSIDCVNVQSNLMNSE